MNGENSTINREAEKLKVLESELEQIKQRAKKEYQQRQTESPIREGGLRPDIFPSLYTNTGLVKESLKKDSSTKSDDGFSDKDKRQVKPTYLEREHLVSATRLIGEKEAKPHLKKNKFQTVFWVGLALMAFSLISLVVFMLT